MQTTPAQQGTTPATGTLAHGYVAFYLAQAAQLEKSTQALHALFVRRKDGAERDAIWDGCCAVKRQAQDYIEKLRDRGGLLFVGSAVALRAAQALEAQRDAATRAKAAA